VNGFGRIRDGRRKQGVHIDGIEVAAPPAVFADHFYFALLLEYRTHFRFAKEPEDTFGAAARAATTEYRVARLKNAKIVFREQSRQQAGSYGLSIAPASTVMAQRAIWTRAVKSIGSTSGAAFAMPRSSSVLVHCMTSIASGPSPLICSVIDPSNLRLCAINALAAALTD
jgi:hypothetical protein